MRLGVSTATQEVHGNSIVFQAVNPPLDVRSVIIGKYNYLCTNVNCHILIVVNGYTEDERGALKNFEARILLEDDWSEGVANYTFLKDGEWIEMSKQKVKAIDDFGVNNLKELAAAAKD
jgi:hypothetical protein